MFGWLGRLIGRGGPRRGRSSSGLPADSLGFCSEQQARAFLERAGFRILQTNYRCPLGEIDLVAEDDGRLVFVEVKSRRLSGEGPTPRPEAAVTSLKQRKIAQAARYYCRVHRRGKPTIVRFDVIAVEWPQQGPPVIRHHVNAFRPRR